MAKSPDRIQFGLIVTVLALVVALPLLYLFNVLEAKESSSWPLGSVLFLYVNVCCVVMLLIFEVRTMTTNRSNNRASDGGYISAVVTIVAVLYMPVIDRYSWHIFNIHSYSGYFYILGLCLFVAGIVLRRAAAEQLGEYFTHELRISPGQTIVDSGPYRHIRHPAYLGTLILTLGFSWAFLSNIGLLMVMPMMIMALYRIKKEEEMLQRSFGEQYKAYMLRTKRIIPFLL